MTKIKHLFKKIKKHKKELGLFGAMRWLVFAVKFRTTLLFSRVKNLNKEGNLNLGKKEDGVILKGKRPKIFIFAGIPFYDIGGGQRAAQLTLTFNSLGYEVYYLFARDSGESKIYKMEIPTVIHKNIEQYSLEDFGNHVSKDDLIIIEFPDGKFLPYVEFAHKKSTRIVYENIDNWESSLGGEIFVRKNLNEVLKYADILVGTSCPLVEQLKQYCKELKMKKKILYEPNAVDDGLFNIHKIFDKPDDFIDGEKTLVYYGTLWGEWFDWELVYGVAKNFPTYSILLIGEYENIRAKIKNAPRNVHFLGIKKQSDLPAYLYHADFALLPFKVDKIVESVSPLKIFEYLAMGKIVLSTALPEVIEYPNVIIGNTVKEWVKGIKKAKKVDTNSSMEFVSKNNWYCRCTDILLSVGIIEKAINEEFYQNISIIILNYNNMNCIFDCVDSLLRYSGRYQYEIIVVDNKSQDGSYEKLKKEYRNRIKLIRNEKNNCSSSRNLGIKGASHDYILILDSDQYALNDYWLDCYLYIMRNYKNIGAIGWAAGSIRINKHGMVLAPYHYMPANGLYRTNIHYLDSGGMFVKKKILERVGFFDEIYDSTCYGDVDLSFAIRNKGYELAYSPYLNIYHTLYRIAKNEETDHNKMLDKYKMSFMNKWKKINPDSLKS